MNEKEKKMILDLREFVRKQYNGLEGKSSALAMMKVSDTAWVLSSIVNSLDDVLKEYVVFKKK